MNKSPLPARTAIATGAFIAATRSTDAADVPRLDEALRSTDDAVRGRALDSAADQGAGAIPVVAPLLSDSDTEANRAGKRALERITRRAGRPGAGPEARAVEAAMLAALGRMTTAQAKRTLLWLLSEIGGADTVRTAALLLADAALREDARCVLQRIPGSESLKALKEGFKKAPEDFKPALAESLRKRGENVTGYPSQRLIPRKPTQVTAAG